MVQLYDSQSSPDDDFFNMEQLFYDCPGPVMNYWVSNVDRPLRCVRLLLPGAVE